MWLRMYVVIAWPAAETLQRSMSQVASRKVRGSRVYALLADKPIIHSHLGEILDGHSSVILS